MSDEEIVELTFELDGGTLNGTSENFVALVNKGRNTTLPKPAIKEGYEFVSWDNYEALSEYNVEDAHTFKAIYKPSNLYYFVEGENYKMNDNNIVDAKYHIKRSNLDDETILHFKGLDVNGTNVIDINNKKTVLDNCKIEEGSLVLTLNKDYIKKLSVGKHNLTFNFEETSISTTLEIVKDYKRDVPSTSVK